MIGCGLAFDFYKAHLPDRTSGEILDRRLHLIRSGRACRPALL